jgi:hypothetical protein
MFYLHVIQTDSGANPAFYKMGTESVSTGVKLLEREVDQSPPSLAEIKNTWIYTTTPPYVFMV